MERSLVLTLIAALQLTDLVYGQAEGLSPFCQICKCTYLPDQDPDVDCSTVTNAVNYLYEETYWFDYADANNKSFPVNSFKMQFVDLRTIKSQFLTSNLTKLDLSNNSIVSIEDIAFANLENMEELVLSYNDLSIMKPEAFRGLRTDGRDYPLRALKIFRASHNKLHTLDQDLFEHLDNIEILDISYNPFTVIDVQTQIAINSLAYLKELYMSYTQLKELPQYFLHTPKYLTVLDISGNLFEEIPQPLSESHSLEVLYMDNNPILNITKQSGFSVIKTVKKLSMCNMPKLHYIGAESLSGLRNLEELHLSDNIDLEDIDTKALTWVEDGAENEIWVPVRKVYLQNNKLTSLDRHLILKWDGLIEMDLRENPWTCECENQWLVDELMPAYIKINETMAKEMTCAAPIEMKGIQFYDLYERRSNMRCLDLYGNRPEKDATILVGILAGLLIGIPLVLLIMFAYQRHWFGVFDSSPAAFSRQFYSKAGSDDVNF